MFVYPSINGDLDGGVGGERCTLWRASGMSFSLITHGELSFTVQALLCLHIPRTLDSADLTQWLHPTGVPCIDVHGAIHLAIYNPLMSVMICTCKQEFRNLVSLVSATRRRTRLAVWPEAMDTKINARNAGLKYWFIVWSIAYEFFLALWYTMAVDLMVRGTSLPCMVKNISLLWNTRTLSCAWRSGKHTAFVDDKWP